MEITNLDKQLKTEFTCKTEIVQCLVEEWGYRTSQFYNNATNQQVEKRWTYNRCLKHLFDLRRNYVRTEHSITRKGFTHLID